MDNVSHYHNQLKKSEAKIQRKIFATQAHRSFGEILKFSVTAAMIFVISFLAMNSDAYWQEARFLANELKAKLDILSGEQIVQIETEKIKQSEIKPQSKKLVAQKTVLKKNQIKTKTVPPLSLNITPPDNRIIISRLNIHAPIREAQKIDLEKNSWGEIEKQIQKALKDGVVHFPGTANPGERGNAFITGHSSYYPWDSGRYKDIFALLPRVKIGDEIVVWQDQQKYIYRVTETKEVNPENISVLAESNQHQLTLMTCIPLGTILKRLIVIAELA